MPYIMMHMRGTPQTMTSKENTTYTKGRLAAEVGSELQQRIDLAVSSGVEPWRILTDPGRVGSARAVSILGNSITTPIMVLMNI